MLMYHTFDSETIKKFYTILDGENKVELSQACRLRWLQNLLECFIFNTLYTDYCVVVMEYPDRLKRVCLEHDMPTPTLTIGMAKLTDFLDRVNATSDFKTYAEDNGLLMGLQTVDKGDFFHMNLAWRTGNRIQTLIELHKRQGYVENWLSKQEAPSVSVL